MRYSDCVYYAQVALTSFITLTCAHSWVEQLTVIDPNGTFTGAPGFVRGNVLRGPGFSDPLMVNLLPPDGRPVTEGTRGILKTDPMCKDSQKKQIQTDGSPRLQAAPGDLVALRYQENGHVTLPDNQIGKPANRGTVYIYGTNQPAETDTFLGIFKQWNKDGTGGDKRGKLLVAQDFDDGQCYQINGGSISVARQAQFPHLAAQPMGADLWCQNNIKLPSDAPTDKPYTLYWVWSWPTKAGVDPGLPNGKEEIYTSCMDIDMDGKPSNNGAKAATYANQKNENNTPRADNTVLNNAAIPKYLKQLNGGSALPSPQSTIEPQKSSTSQEASQTLVTVTVTREPEEKTTTIYVTAPNPTESAASTTIVTIPKSTVIHPGKTVLSTVTASTTATASGPTDLPTSKPGTDSDGVSYSPRRKRSRFFGSYHKN